MAYFKNWTVEMVEELKHRWDAAETCAAIGVAMGVTRNAVIGKVHRLGLPLRGLTQAELLKRELNRQKRKASQLAQQRDRRRARGEKQMQDLPPAPEPFLGSLNISFVDIRDYSSKAPNQCRFIAADAAGLDTLYCGNETLPGESYCGHCREFLHYRPLNVTEEDRARRRAHWTKLGVAKSNPREPIDLVEVA